jgi:hypothetical protein
VTCREGFRGVQRLRGEGATIGGSQSCGEANGGGRRGGEMVEGTREATGFRETTPTTMSLFSLLDRSGRAMEKVTVLKLQAQSREGKSWPKESQEMGMGRGIGRHDQVRDYKRVRESRWRTTVCV